MEKTDIKKRVHAYLFRHTRITEAASFMTESEMDHYFGWVQGSNMPQVYVHLSGREVDDKLLRHYKLKKSGRGGEGRRETEEVSEVQGGE